MDRLRIKVVGGSGSGLLSTGKMLTEALLEMGFFAVGDREYQSVIKGGHASYTVNIAREPIYGQSQKADVMLMLDRPGFEEYHSQLKDGGILLHAYDKVRGIQGILDELEGRGCTVIGLEGRKAVEEMGGRILMVNVILLGMFWKLMGFDPAILENQIQTRFAKKPHVIPVNLKCLELGYAAVDDSTADTVLEFAAPKNVVKRRLVGGNQAIALGAVRCGVRAYFAYPMSPASSVLTYLAQYADKSGMVVKQAEDEITAAQMATGAMWMGTRSFTATSGGGVDLMGESISLAGIIENPLVIVNAQRPGPATGLPTWTCQGDLDMCVHAGHGEFPRVVIGVSDAQDAFEQIQHAFNIAEKFQCVVIVLTEKQIAETIWSIESLQQKDIPIERGLVEGAELDELTPDDRFKFTASGLSKRWIPGSSDAFYFANGDEHDERGRVNEDAENATKMIAKRIKKMDLIVEALPQPEVFGPENADISFVGWGSSKSVMQDSIADHAARGIKVNYLHVSYVHPLRTEKLAEFFAANKNVHLIEGNHDGQLGNRIEAKGFTFKGRLLKWNGRSFFLEDLSAYIDQNL